jgi:hypothetical protein
MRLHGSEEALGFRNKVGKRSGLEIERRNLLHGL